MANCAPATAQARIVGASPNEFENGTAPRKTSSGVQAKLAAIVAALCTSPPCVNTAPRGSPLLPSVCTIAAGSAGLIFNEGNAAFEVHSCFHESAVLMSPLIAMMCL